MQVGNDLPLLTKNPVVSIVRDPNAGEQDYTLLCSWNTVDSNYTLQYHVEWIINDVIVQEQALDNRSTQAFINRTLLTSLAYGSRVCKYFMF